MIAVRRLSRDEWKERLECYKFRPLLGKGPLNTAEWWQSPWGYPFTVPVEDDDTCDQWAIEKLILDVMSTAPTGFSFED